MDIDARGMHSHRRARDLRRAHNARAYIIPRGELMFAKPVIGRDI